MDGFENFVRVVIWVSVLADAAVRGKNLDENFQTLCSQRCPFQNSTENHFDIGCGNECKIGQCFKGCRLWRKALESSCQAVCNGTQNMLSQKELHCVIGCNDAVNQYFQKLKDDIGTPPAPYLVADTLTATSLRLAWEGARYSEISYLVQWRYEEHAGAWQYCRNQSWGSSSVISVEDLQPYTKYRFRVALLLSPHSEPIVSEPSVVISTLAAGTPSSPPILIRATAVDSKRISVSWKPGPFPNGPIHSYVLVLEGGFVAIKEDIPAAKTADFYMFQNLSPNSKYLISISMRNAVGEGPSATAEISTPPEPTVKDALQPILILGSNHRVIKQGADMMLEAPLVIYETSSTITGVGIHVRQNLLFVSDSDGYVSATSLKEFGKFKHLLTPYDMSFKPFDLSIDWLNEHLYVLGEIIHNNANFWQVARSTLDGKGLTVAVAGITNRPLHVEVDPYNGYLFWLIQGPNRGGLYRLDLANISNGIKHEVVPDVILENPNLGAFVVDHVNFCILIPNQKKNTVYSVSLDGREVVDLRSNTQQPLFQNVLSLAVANGLFYWTDGEEVLAEDYHEEYHTYFHNHYLGSKNRSYISVHVDLPTSQPIPVPVNPPIQVQAVLGGHLAKISWQTPHIVGGQGKGAWQNWSYEVQIKSLKTNIVRTLRDINNTFFTVEGLEEDTEYIIKAAAYTSSGNGPWSSEFKGKTIKTSKNGNFPSLLWSAAEGLLESDVTGEELEILISQENLKEGNSNYHFTDVSWYRDMLFLVSNTSKAYWYNLTNREYGQFHHLDSVGSIAVDWMGKKLYWSNPKQQLIIRGDLKGRSPEPLLILTIAKELTIDSEQAYIYWSTGHAVECATLNGDDRRVYYPAELFSGKQVMGLALNMDDRHVYWIVRSNEGSNLYKAPMLQLGDTTPKEPEVTRISRLLYANMQGPMCYFSDHLLWLQDNRNAVIADLFGKNVALLSGLSLSSLNMVSVRDINLQDFQDNERFVIPEPIDESSISITGTSSSFNITWKPVTNVNYGKVFYDVKTEDYSKESFAKTDLNELVYERGKDLLPYTKIKVTLQAYTYWGSSPRVVKVIRSPPSPPGKPSNPRVFLTSHRNLKNEDIRVVALLRWDHPKEPNGLITAYKVKYSAVSQDADQFFEINLKPDTLEVELENLQINATYYFQIKASTLAGEGNFTEPIYTNTSVEVPVPMILAATEDSIQIIDCDRDTHKTLSSGDKPLDIALNSHEGWLYWLNDMQEIVGMSLDGTSKTKMHIMNGTGLTMAIDWIGRFLYWSEADDINETESTCTVYRIDLTQLENGITHVDKILVRTRRIQDLKISPFTNTLYWIETNQDGERHLMQSQTDGSGIRPFFSKQAGNSGRQCAFAENPKIGKTMAVDLSDPYHVSVIYSDERRGRLYSAESSGCKCKLIVRSLSSPPTSLAADRENVFWSDETKNAIFFLKRDSEIRAFTLQGVKKIIAAGLHLQPYPPTRCLLVKQYNETPSLVDHGATSITLSLPRPERDPDCRNISTPSMQYVVYFDQLTESGHSECANSISSCKSIVTYDRVVKINNLKPFSSYFFIVSVRNYLGNLESGPIISSPAVFDTLAGAPPAPLNVTATVLTPIAVEVQWFTSENSKDKTISYQVHWRTEGLIGGVRQSGEQIVESAGNRISQKVIVSRLMPGQIYLIWVRACSKLSPTYSDSKRVEVRTFDQPHNITLVKATPYALEIDWEPPENLNCEFNIEFRQFSEAEPWEKIKNSNEKNGDHYIINNLLPKTFYKFRIAITYVESNQTYIWPLEGFGFETLGDRPGRPGTPVIQELRKDVYQVLWTKSRENGAAIDYYALEGFVKKIWRRKRETDYNSSLENRAPFEQWNLYYNGTENYWIISNLSPNLKHVFRVKAKNKFGWSDFSERSKSFDFAEAAMLADQEEFGVVLGTAVPLLFLCCVVIFIIFCCVTKIRDKEKKELQILTLTPTNRGPDVELATLRELPRRANFIQNANVLYGTSSGFPFDEEIALLPHIRREQFKLTKFLGSGAFGEVYEGIAQGLPRTGNGTRVAIKALRKGATENEKAEFLREAQLMSHFKHEHILQLLGVCLDNDPNYILMELMEGGDLLSYLRMNRPLIKTNNALKLQDLLEMCLDVTKGCRYLEEMHFVHRDLACRNCLVSSKDPRTRIVKIGDFGLARDIYKNDYYRKEGEGLLPVRWMAPESLVDGVFTSQSDVWAFGVLIWEIMTLGQQPYPARTNLEVLHYVRGGGRLGRPINCSEELHQLMMKCWSFNPEHRPTFKYCLDTLRDLKQQSTNSLLTPDFGGNYVEARIRRSEDEDDGHENDGFCGSENDSDLALNKPESNCDTDDESSGAVTVISQEPHQYLELLYEDQMPESDGYEIPRFSCRKADETRDQDTTSDQGKEEESHESYSENLDIPKKLVSNSVAPSAS